MWNGNGANQQTVHSFQLFWRQRGEDVIQTLVHVDASADAKAQTVTYGILCKQDGTPSVSFHVIHDLAKANPAGVHSTQYVGRGNISMGDPESNRIEGDLIGSQAVQRRKRPWHRRHHLAKVAQHCQISKNFVVFGPEK